MILVDGNLLAHRAFHKMDFLKNKKGVPTGLEFGFLRSLEYLEKSFAEHKIVIVFDTKTNFKRENCKRYKSERSTMNSSFYDRLKTLQAFLRNFWDLSWMEGVEADDILYTLAMEQANKGEEAIIYSNDNDLLQCIDDEKNISVLKSHGSQLFKYDESRVEEKFFVLPEHLPLFRAFVGDKSDNLDGVPRIQKRKLADALAIAIDRAGDFEGWEADIANYISDFTGWSYNMSAKIDDFVTCGMWRENYDLMKLQEWSNYTYAQKLKEVDKELVLNSLREWEIGSLRLCESYKKDLVDPESEF